MGNQQPNRLSRRTFLLALGAGASVTLLAACAPVAPGGAAPAADQGAAAPAAEGAKIVWLTLDWSVEQVLADFKAAKPEIEVQAEQTGFNELFQQIQIRLAAGDTSPDVISVDVPLVASYGFRNWLLNLDDVFSADEKADWLDAAITAGSYEGHLLAAPVSTSTQLLFYNKKILDEAGVTPPGQDERWTWDQVATAAQQLTKDTNNDGTPDVWGFIWEQMVRIYQLQPLPVSLGGKAIGDDGLSVDGIINSKEWVDAFTYYWQTFNEWKVAPQGDVFWPPDIFEKGSLAMFVGGPWNIRRFHEAKVDFEWGVSRHPYFTDGKIATPTGSWHIGVNLKSEQQPAATEFVKWISTGKGAETWWRKGSGDFPAQKSVLELFKTDPEFDAAPLSFLRTAADEATVNPEPRPVTPGYLEYEQILQDTFQDIRNGTKPEEALQTAVDRIGREMRKYQK